MLTIKFTRSGVSGIGRRLLQEVGRAAMLHVGNYWVKHYLPIHFTRRALRRYGYAPRQGDPGSGHPFKGSYAESKVLREEFPASGIRAIGENKPLVWSGRSRQMALGSSQVNPVAENYARYRADITIPANTLNFLRKRINAEREIRAVSPDEERMLEIIFATAYEAELNRHGRTQKTTKTIAA